ncbi:unnamed protein product, partial [Polarella glacialis]
FVMLGAASGVCLGFFGVGPAWMLAPLVTRTSQAWADYVARNEAIRKEETEAWVNARGPPVDTNNRKEVGAGEGVSGE